MTRLEMLRQWTRTDYERDALEYSRTLPLEHFMEATPQSTQREISLESFAIVKAARPDVHFFNELLVQYPLKEEKRPGQVVPDNMVVLHNGPVKPEGSYDIPLQPAKPFMMLEYVSKNTKRKDYDDNMDKYEHKLKVPYYLLFQPDVQELTLYHHSGRKYASVKPNEHGRLAIPELEMEVAILDEWVRFWFRGELLPLPAELQRALRQTRQQLADALGRLEQERQARQAAEDELALLLAQLGQSGEK